MKFITKLFPFNQNKKKYSYSQCGEDIIIEFIFNNLKMDCPSYIDIGAHDPFYLNNTALLYAKGSSGINIEADPKAIKKFRKYRKRDINLNVGVSENDGVMDFYMMNCPTLNTFSKDEAIKLREDYGFDILETKKIHTHKLSRIIAEYCKGIFPDFLTIDVEGIEIDILKDIDYTKIYPKVICCETISYSENGMGIKDYSIIKYLESKGYLVYADTYINTIFVKEHLWRRSDSSRKEQLTKCDL